MKKLCILPLSILLMGLASCNNSKKSAEEIIKSFETEISAVGFNVQDNSFQGILDKYSSELENEEVKTIVNKKISDLFNTQLKKHVIKISVKEKACKGNVGEYLVIQKNGPLKISSEDNVFSIPFEIKLKEEYKQLFEHDFSIVNGILLNKQSDVLTDEFGVDVDIDVNWEKIINGESTSEKGKLRCTFRSLEDFGSTKNLIEKYIKTMKYLNKIGDISIQVDRGKNSAPSASSNNSDNLDNSTSTTEETVSEGDGDCDQIFNDYEAFVRSNLATIKKIKADPTNMANKAEFARMELQSASMETGIMNCIKSDPTLSTRLLKLKKEIGL